VPRARYFEISGVQFQAIQVAYNVDCHQVLVETAVRRMNHQFFWKYVPIFLQYNDLFVATRVCPRLTFVNVPSDGFAKTLHKHSPPL